MFNKIGHRPLKSVLISVNQWLKKMHFGHRFAQITLIFMALSKNPVIYHREERRGAQRIGLKTLCSLGPLWLNPVAFTACVGSIRPQQVSLDFLIVSIFINRCQPVRRGCA